MHTVLEILNLSTDHLKQKGIQHPRRQAEELLGEALGIGRMGLYMQFDRPLNPEELDRCRSWLKRRALGEPLQYIRGEVDFFDCKISVNPHVLIPRQETEILVDKIAKELDESALEGKALWDVCCGPGSIGIALKKRFPSLKVFLSDISPEALAVAEKNAISNGVDVDLLQGDLLKPFQGQHSDFIVCNPPYISEKDYETLEVEVRAHEPKRALVGGKTGLEFYERLATDLPTYLKSSGKVWFEIGDGQGKALQQLFCAPCWKQQSVELDWSGRERFFSLEYLLK